MLWNAVFPLHILPFHSIAAQSNLAHVYSCYNRSMCRSLEIRWASIVTFECDKYEDKKKHNQIGKQMSRMRLRLGSGTISLAFYRMIVMLFCTLYSRPPPPPTATAVSDSDKLIIIIIEIVWHFRFTLVTSSMRVRPMCWGRARANCSVSCEKVTRR